MTASLGGYRGPDSHISHFPQLFIPANKTHPNEDSSYFSRKGATEPVITRWDPYLSASLQIGPSRKKCTKATSHQAGLINKEQGNKTASKSKLAFFTSLRICLLFIINKHGALWPAQDGRRGRGLQEQWLLKLLRLPKCWPTPLSHRQGAAQQGRCELPLGFWCWSDTSTEARTQVCWLSAQHLSSHNSTETFT